MKRIFLSLFLLISFASLYSAELGFTESGQTADVKFDLYFKKNEKSVIRFTEPDNPNVEKTEFDFTPYSGAVDVNTNPYADIGIYWQIYEPAFALKLEFVESLVVGAADSGYMLRGSSDDNKTIGYNYSVTIDGAEKISPIENNPQNSLSLDARTVLFLDSARDGLDTGDSQPESGSTVLHLELPIPAEGFVTGQYFGVIRMTLDVK